MLLKCCKKKPNFNNFKIKSLKKSSKNLSTNRDQVIILIMLINHMHFVDVRYTFFKYNVSKLLIFHGWFRKTIYKVV